jgi:predicted dehydrogenase
MRIGIVGCGLIGNKRAQAAREKHEICIVADRDGPRAEALARQTNARVATDWKEVIESDVEAVVVATLHESLATIALAAVISGKHVLVEKPAGRRASELEPVLKASIEHDRVVKVGFNHRFHPSFLKAREIVDSGVIGPVMFIRARYGHGGRVGYESEWRCVEQLSGGGELIDQGTHLIDLSRWFLGDVTLDYAATPTLFWNIGVDDNCFLALRAPNGGMAWLHASWTEWKNLFVFEIAGRYGKLQIDGLGGSYGVERLTHYQMLPAMGPPETTIWEFPFPDHSWKSEFEHFAECIQFKRRPMSDVADAVAILRLVDQAYARGDVP